MNKEDFIGNIYKQHCGDYLKVLEKTDKYNSQRNVLFHCIFVNYPYEIFETKQHILNGSVINPQIEKVEFVDKIWPQNCGDSLRILKRTQEKKGTTYLWECEFIKYPYKILALKNNIICGRVENPQIEVEEFINKKWPQNCGDILRVLKKSNKKQGNNCFYECEFIKVPYKILAVKKSIIKGTINNPYYIDIENFPFLQKESLIDFINQNFKNKKPTLKELANKLNISDSYMGKFINKFDLRDFVHYFPVSQQEQEIRNFCKKLNNSTLDSSIWNLIPKKEIDIYIQNKNIGIEFNGNLWHSTDQQFGILNNDYHQQKSIEAQNKGIFLMQIFEYEYEFKKDIIYSLIKTKLGIFNKKIGSSRCIIKNLSNKEYQDFCESNHLQGSCGAKIKLGLFYKEELVQIMSFGVPRFTDKYEWEIIRECSKLEYFILGGKERLWNYFVKNYYPNSVISYCDFSKFTGQSYIKLGFKQERLNKPGFVWYNKSKNQVYWRDAMHNQEILKQNYLKIFDCGQLVFTWNKN